ncbi:FAD-dependent oxidoreductase [Desulfococcaceae bacterium OttesenSCG-928-F15]|nr:FAD-dependent oxidoreductase [Desulfococcaceae bacterium OttesenSCG-928-F15]
MAENIIGSVLIAGGGIASIQAALDLADSGYYVYMVEKSPSIGGVMAQLDKTFPTNDCSMCIMSPKLVEVGRHINIELITLAEIKDIRGEAGNFEVEVFQRARYVDLDKCIGCGACTEKCPKKVDDDYNMGLAKRKAIYVPYPQAVPLKYAIDGANCIKLTKDKCGNCEKVCPAGAINYKDTDKTLKLNVGSVILATGFSAYNPTGKDFLNYDQSRDVVTSLEFERLLSASGPFQGHVVRLSDQGHPHKIAWLQCVGSRDVNTCNNGYCSSVCCMYAIKQAIIAKEHDPELEAKIFYMDMRTHGKGFEDCYNQAKSTYGVKFQRCRVHTVYTNPDGPGQVLEYIDDEGKRATEVFDLVVLSVGIEITPEVRQNACNMGIELTEGGFVKTNTFAPVATSRDGVYVCGAFQGPKDIPQSVVEAGAAALNAGAGLASVRNTLTKTLIRPEEEDVRGDRPRIGVFVCHCGINIAGVIDVEAVRDYAAGLPYVEYVTNNMYSCSQDTQDAMTKVIQEKGLNRIVVAACSPRTHEPLFQETLVNASLNKYLFEMVNIRNHGSWVHKDNPEEATAKAKEQVRMAVAKVALCEPLSEATLEIDQNVLVIGGGISGLSTAKALSSQGYHVTVVERDAELGGQARNLFTTAKGESIEEGLNALIDEVRKDANIDVRLNARLSSVEGFVGNFRTGIDTDGTVEEIKHGVAIIATGAGEAKPTEYGYGTSKKVMTGQELDSLMKKDDPALKTARTAVFIQCVGSREPDRPYCSRICCTHTVVSALHLKEKNPDMDIFVLYRDIRTYGEKEYLYKKARDLGVIFIRYELVNKPQVTMEGENLSLTVTDHILKRPLILSPDLLVLASAVVPYKDERLAQFFKVPLNDDGFFVEAHVKLAPSDFATDGVFLAGLAHYPKPIDEAIAQAQAAAARATGLLARKTINTSGTVAYVNTAFCSSCGVCVAVCPYNAPGIIPEGPRAGKAEINPVLCKGCGACVSSCRSGALNLKGFEEAQILAMIDAA